MLSVFTFPWVSDQVLFACFHSWYIWIKAHLLQLGVSCAFKSIGTPFSLQSICGRRCHLGLDRCLHSDFVDCIPVMSIFHVPAPSIFFDNGSKITDLIRLHVICRQEELIGNVACLLFTSPETHDVCLTLFPVRLRSIMVFSLFSSIIMFPVSFQQMSSEAIDEQCLDLLSH